MVHCRNSRRCRPGIVVPAVVLLLIGLIGITALTIDGALLMTDRKRTQAAADAAALAAAIDLFENHDKNQGTDPAGTAADSAKKTATDNGYTNGVLGTTVTVNIPPLSGAHKKPGYAEVIVTMQQQRYFSTIYGSGKLPVTARAVARGTRSPK